MKGRININRKILSIILCIVLISVFSLTIAYAALSVTLNITGTAEVSDATWNIRFNNIKVNPASVSITPKITNNTTLTFSASLTEPGDFYKFTVDIVNEGTIDAMIDSIVKTPELTTEQKKYLKFEVEYSDGQSINTKQILKAKETKTISVLFSFRTDIPTSDLPKTSSNFNVSLKLVYYQSDTTGVNITTGANKVNVVSGDMDTVGSEICIKNECFYVISSDNYSVTMLAKYNLLVGNRYDKTNGVVALENPTGIQDITAKGWFSGYSPENPIIGGLPFSSTNYWYDGTGIKKEYGTSYPVYVYDSNCNLYVHVENYRTYLENQGVDVEDARVISVVELEKLGCVLSKLSCKSAPSWVYATTYWTGDASSNQNKWRVGIDGGVFNDGGSYSIEGDRGVRPVITISKTDF